MVRTSRKAAVYQSGGFFGPEMDCGMSCTKNSGLDKACAEREVLLGPEAIVPVA